MHKVGRNAAGAALVLVVDDNVAMRRLIDLALTRAGYHVVPACDGGAALALLDEGREGHVHPQVILLDMNMPVMDGWAFCRAYHPAGARVPIVVMTGGGGAAECAAEVGADASLSKPFPLGDLVACIQR